jgi:predicted acetyltransferase
MSTASIALLWPSMACLPGYAAALRRGWSPNTTRDESAEELAKIAADAAGHVAAMINRDGGGEPVTLPDGSRVPRLPGFRQFIWDQAADAFCGVVSLRWQKGSTELPPHVLGHLGYSVVPWQQRRGIGTRALALLLAQIPREVPELDHVIVTTDIANTASQKVIVANGGALLARYTQPASHGGRDGLRYRIAIR